MSVVRGSCLCGDVAWEATGPLEFVSHCHCGRCRKAHGAAFATYAMVPEDRFRLVRGGERIVRFASSPGFVRPFCGRCGSTVPGGESRHGLVELPVGPLDDDPGARPVAHIFVASKAPWYDVTDDLVRFDAFPPGVDAAVLADMGRPRAAGGGVGGSCLCGAVAFVVTAPAVRCQHCHCSRCRKARAAAHASNFFVPIAGLRFTAGEERLRAYAVPGARYFRQVFCEACGSPMPRTDPERGIAVVPMGSLDDDPGVRPAWHIYVGSKAPWFEITDDLPQYAEMPTPA